MLARRNSPCTNPRRQSPYQSGTSADDQAEP
jgi:hypothetical protein